jgi:hypothetical protein
MRNYRLLLVLTFIVPVGFALAIPPHPTVLLVELNGLSAPVVGVVTTDPVVSVDGKDRRIRFEPSFSAARAPHFADGHVEFKRVGFNGVVLKSIVNPGDDPATSGGFMGGTSYFEASIVPSIDIKNGFIAIVMFDPRFLAGEVNDPATEILIHDLKNLPARKETVVKFSTRLPVRRNQSTTFPLVFQAGGAELPSNFSLLIARYFTRVEQVRLATLVSDYRAKYDTVDRAASPVLKIQPTLPAGVALPLEAIMATVTVGENGHVQDVQIPDGLDSQVSIALRETLRGWLFLPRLRGGQPISTRVQIPLTF